MHRELLDLNLRCVATIDVVTSCNISSQVTYYLPFWSFNIETFHGLALLVSPKCR